MIGPRTHTWQTPPRMRQPKSPRERMRDGSVIRQAIDSKTHSGLVPEGGAAEPRVGASVALFAMCVSRDDRPPDAHMANTATYAPAQISPGANARWERNSSSH